MSHRSSKKRILIFSLGYYPMEGGAEIAVKEITSRISDIEFDMITMRFDKAHPEKEQVGLINVHRINSSKTLFPIEAFLHARRLHAERQYDAIWSIMAARAGGAALFFKMSFPNVFYILTLQEGDPIWYMKLRSLYYINPLFRKIFAKADIIQAISNYLADYARAMGYGGRVEVIPNGVDAKLFSVPIIERDERRRKFGFKSDDIVMITTSRLVGKNRVEDIVEALQFLPGNVKLLILGEGPLEEKLRRTIEKLKLQDRVRLAGHIPYENVSSYLKACDIFVRAPISEGFGNSFIEAMAAGLPVIATPVGGIPDFLIDKETGLFAEPGKPETISREVRRLLNDDDLKRKLIENGHRLVEEKYDWNLIANEMRRKVLQRQ